LLPPNDNAGQSGEKRTKKPDPTGRPKLTGDVTVSAAASFRRELLPQRLSQFADRALRVIEGICKMDKTMEHAFVAMARISLSPCSIAHPMPRLYRVRDKKAII